VWRSRTVWAPNTGSYYYLAESEFPHVGGPRIATDGYILYIYGGSNIVRVAHWSNADGRWKWHNSNGECDIVVRRVSDATVTPNWQAAPAQQVTSAPTQRPAPVTTPPAQRTAPVTNSVTNPPAQRQAPVTTPPAQRTAPVTNTQRPFHASLSEATWSAAPDARKAFYVKSTDAEIDGYYSYSAVSISGVHGAQVEWLKAADAASPKKCTLQIFLGTNAVFYKQGSLAPAVSYTLSKAGTFESSSVRVIGSLRDVTGTWNGARALQMTWFGAQLTAFVPVEHRTGAVMRDVWQSSTTVWGKVGLYLYLAESEIPHVGGPRRIIEAFDRCLYQYDGTNLQYIAYMSKTDGRWKWHNSDGACDIVVRSVHDTATPQIPTNRVTHPPVGMTTPSLNEWRQAEQMRKCFRVTMTNPQRKNLGGWFSFISSSVLSGYVKAAYTIDREDYAYALIGTKLADGLETVTISWAGLSVTCALSGVRGTSGVQGYGVQGVTSDVKVECFIRPQRPQTKWPQAVNLDCAIGVDRFTFSRLDGLSDVWVHNGTQGIYLAENGCTHVGGPPVDWQGCFIYEYDRTKVPYKVTYLLFCTDNGKQLVNWFRCKDKTKIDNVSVRAA
jgi:hypothetical protein